MVVLLFAAVALAACSGGVEAPEGFTAVSAGSAGFAHPDGWEVAEGQGNLVALGQTGAGELRQHAILQIDDSFSGDFDTGVDGLNTLANADLTDRQVLADTSVDVPGAQQARLVTSSYRVAGEDPSTLVDSRQLTLFALGSDDTLYVLEAGAPAELFDEQTFRAIVDSFTLEG